MKIIELVTKSTGVGFARIFTVGMHPTDGASLSHMGNSSPVESIKYFRHAYNKGYQADYPAYVIAVEDSDIRTIIPQDEVAQIKMDIESDKKSESKIPELPSSQVAGPDDVSEVQFETLSEEQPELPSLSS